MTIKHFSIEYDAINSRNTFTNGDTINGRIIVELSKETNIRSLVFIAQGFAHVFGGEGHRQGGNCTGNLQNVIYYNVKHHILREARQDGTKAICKGRHVFPFSFKIPNRKIPSSLKADIGVIVHQLNAELKQSKKLKKRVETQFTFVSKPDLDIPGLMEPKYGYKDKSVQGFGSGNVSMHAQIKQMGYKQGEAVKVTVDINNNSTKSVKPKFTLYEMKSFYIQGLRRVYPTEILKEKVEAVASSSQVKVTKVIPLPMELHPSILNCSIIKLEYVLEIRLDMKCVSDPRIILPIVVLPASEGPAVQQAATSAGIGPEAFGSPFQTQWSVAPPQQAALQPADHPPAYGEYALYPPFPDSGRYQSMM